MATMDDHPVIVVAGMLALLLFALAGAAGAESLTTQAARDAAPWLIVVANVLLLLGIAGIVLSLHMLRRNKWIYSVRMSHVALVEWAATAAAIANPERDMGAFWDDAMRLLPSYNRMLWRVWIRKEEDFITNKEDYATLVALARSIK